MLKMTANSVFSLRSDCRPWNHL